MEPSQGSFTDTEQYRPRVDVKRSIESPTSQSEVEIIAKVIDKYGRIENASLYYSINDGIIWNRTDMDLINGNPSNGTFSAIIPRQKENTTVSYKLYLEDNLGYSYNSTKEEYFIPDLSTDTTPPEIVEFGLEEPIIGFPTNLFAYVSDNSIPGPKNVTIIYSTDSNANNYTRIMDYDIISDEYTGTIEPIFKNTNVTYYLKACDYSNNCHSTEPQIFAITGSADQLARFNKIIINPMISGLDIRNLKAEAQIGIEGKGIDEVPLHYFIEVINVDETNYQNSESFYFPINVTNTLNLTSESEVQGSRVFNIVNDKDLPFKTSISLLGDLTKYPFDNYYLNLILVVPVSNSRVILNTPQFTNFVTQEWIASSKIFNTTNDTSYSPDVCNENVENITNTFYCLLTDVNEDISYVNLVITFQRNNLIPTINTTIIIIPLLAIFFLLGTIFMLESTTDHLSNKLAVTIGIFGFLFSFTPIINEVKPSRTLGVLTVADFLIAILLIATIIFSTSSVISSSSSIRKRYPRHWVWIDRIVFVFVSIVIIYFSFFYPSDITLWLVPFILFGLGYGLLIRLFRSKIALKDKKSIEE
jgi:hypothetical protein